MALVELFGNEVVGKSGNVQTSSLESKDVVGIYFSAHWCPPCRNFTPVLAANYTSLTEQGKAFEIVFVSSDREEGEAQSYYDSMPWLMLPFGERDRKNDLSKKYSVSGIPTLVLVDAKTGETITKEGRGILSNADCGQSFPWKN
ncbi:nucleoredoxin [Aplysia californica]|uniref:Nucleoredoxin n=1 Tax=Aplysia californica TaxID=6500 RepID=A0ABM0ZXV4_APLCA|nr:nucleoredoxin [Aplysia californica]